MPSKRILWLIVILLVAGCAVVAGSGFDKLFGPADPTRFDTPPAGPASASYAQVIQPILENWNNRRFDFPNYDPGTWGPSEADAMIVRQGRQWRNS